MKRTKLLVYFFFAMTQQVCFGQAGELIISEYAEGSSGNSKYVEIFNGTGGTIDLGDYQLWRIANGGSWPEASYDFSAASLPDGTTLVVANNSTDVPGADEYSGFCVWSGDDAVGLAKDAGGGNFELLDAIGTDGADPGSGWDVAGVINGTANHRLVRKDSVCFPTTNWSASAGTNASNSEWIVFSYTTGSAISGHTSDCSGAVQCPLDVTVVDVLCIDTTAGIDSFTVFVDFEGGGQGMGTYTITSNNTGDDPDIDTVGTMIFTAEEGVPLDVTITSNECDLFLNVPSPVCIPVPDLVINEFQADPDEVDGDANGDGIPSTTQDEFVEIYNNDEFPVDMSGWTLSDGAEVRHVFENGTMLDPDSFAVVFGGGTPTGIPGQVVVTASTGLIGLNNGGDDIILQDSFGNLVVSYTYGSEGGNDVALGRFPDLTGSFVEHSTIPVNGRLFSPGVLNELVPDCPFILVSTSISCDTVTAGMDNYSVEIDFVGGGQGEGTYTISPAFNGDHPDTTMTGTLVFSGIEGTSIIIQISSSDCNLIDTIASPACSPPPAIVINEFQADPDVINGNANGDSVVNSSEDEFIELYNNDNVTVNLGGWTIYDAGGPRHVFPSGTQLDPDSFAVVFGGGTPTNVPGQYVDVASNGFLGLNNGGDDIFLYDSLGNLITSYTYGSEGGNNQSVGRFPDIDGAFALHSTIPTTGRLFSPGMYNSSNPNCDLLLTFNDPVCSDSTGGADEFTLEVDFTGGGQGGGTYTISPTNTGDDPNTMASGTMIFTATEGDTLMISITSVDCDYSNSIISPSCIADEPCATPGDLVITEFMANPADVPDGEGEYIEIYNRSSTTYNLYGYEISDLGSESHTITNSLSIAPGEFLVFGISSTVPNADYIYSDLNIGNGSDEVLLRCADTSGTVLITGVAYSDGDLFGSGTALELNCTVNPGPLYSETDYVAATDELNYDGDGATDEGSPGTFGNTDTASAVPIQLVATNYPSTVAAGTPFNITVCAADADSIVPCLYNSYIVLEQVNGSNAGIVDDSVLTENACATFEVIVPSIDSCGTLEFNAYDSSFSLSMNISIELADAVYLEDFTCNSLGWSIENLDMLTTWTCDTTGGNIDMNAFGDTLDSEDWIISPAINLTTHSDLVVSFETRERFDGPPLQFLYSTDYSGMGDPNAATWTSVAFNYDDSQNGFAFAPWTSSGSIGIDSANTPSTYFAFLYTGTPDSIANWLVDDFVITGCPRNCLIDTITLDSISGCDPMTGTFTADVTIMYESAPATGYLILSGDAADTIDVSLMGFDPYGTSYTFEDVEFDADGGLKTVTATFTDGMSCDFSVSDVPGTDVQPCDGGATIFGGLVVNEVWNDASYSGATCFTSKSFIELLVVASIDEDTTTQAVNLQNWIIDPSSQGGDPGHIRIKSGCLTSVPVGALVVIYNADNIPAGISGPDETDADSNLVYYIPSNSSCLEYTTDATFPGSTYEDGNSGTCTHAYMVSSAFSTIPFTVGTRHPHSFMRSYTNVYDDLVYDPTNTVSPGGSSAFICGNIDDISSVMDDMVASPGSANNADNDKLVVQIREEAMGPDPDAVNYYYLLTPGLFPDCELLTARPCVDTLVILGPGIVTDTSSAGSILETLGDITTSGSTVFDAPEILLNAGFEVPLGAEFTTLYVGCSPSASRALSASGKKPVIVRIKTTDGRRTNTNPKPK